MTSIGHYSCQVTGTRRQTPFRVSTEVAIHWAPIGARFPEVTSATPWLGYIYDPPDPRHLHEGQLCVLTLSDGRSADCEVLLVDEYISGGDVHYIPPNAKRGVVWVLLGLTAFPETEDETPPTVEPWKRSSAITSSEPDRAADELELGILGRHESGILVGSNLLSCADSLVAGGPFSLSLLEDLNRTIEAAVLYDRVAVIGSTTASLGMFGTFLKSSGALIKLDEEKTRRLLAGDVLRTQVLDALCDVFGETIRDTPYSNPEALLERHSVFSNEV